MRVTAATEPGSEDVPNEDWHGFTPRAIVVLDGVTLPAGMANGCSHGTPWYVRQLGARLLAGAESSRLTLAEVLAAAIWDVADLHRECDLDSVGAPSATVAVLRLGEDSAEYLVLADVTIVLETAGELTVISDDRVHASVASVDPSAADVGEQIAERREADRNRPGGYWVAAADPEAAVHAVTGSVPLPDCAAVMTDGAARAHDMFGISWETVMPLAAGELISEVRAGEQLDAKRERFPRFKVSDDATAVLWRP